MWKRFLFILFFSGFLSACDNFSGEGAENLSPTADSISVVVEESATKAIILTGSDPELATLIYSITTQPTSGTLSGAAPSVIYTPNEDYNGSDSFEFTVSDGEKTSVAATISITVTAVNTAPTANDASLAVKAGEGKSVVLTGSDPDSINLTYVVTQQPANGALSGNAPNLIYTATAGYMGADSFKFTISDGDKTSVEATVSITVSNTANKPPVADTSSVTTDEDSAKAITLTGSDPESASLSYSIASQPSNGKLSGSAPNVTYTPNMNYSGSDSFAFTVSDGENTSPEAIVSITVTAVNDAPTANDTTLAVKAGEGKGIVLTGSDPDSSNLTYVVTQQPVNGVLSGSVPNLTYTAKANYKGTDSFKFTVTDGDKTSVEATVSITVSNTANKPPIADTSSVTTDEDSAKAITLTGSDPESASLSYSIASQPSNGKLSGSAPNVTYTPNVNYSGSDSFAFTVSDGENTSPEAIVSITVTAVNDAPTANDATLAAKAGEGKGIILTGSDPDSSNLTYAVTQQPVNGVLSGSVPNLTYTAKANYKGADSFKFTVTDGVKTSAEAIISITVTEINVMDRDGDGVPDDKDAFPDDPNESADLDRDGIGDNADPDKDGDGVNNDVDLFPTDPTESADLDGDGVGDNSDLDKDGDGVKNDVDLFPTDPKESADLDSDGIGDNADTDRDGDGVNNEDDFFPDDKDASKVPTVTIDKPKTLITVGSSPITVSGTIDDSKARLVVNGVEVTHTGGQFEVDVSLEEGLNNIVARGIDAKNHEGLATITVSLDKTPPHVTIQSQLEGQTVYTDKISVGGLVNDIVRGAVTEEDAVVRVNGQLATVKNRSYLAENIQLVEGENILQVIASDAVGNIGNKSIKINYEVQTNKIVSLVSGQAQSGVIFETLTEPLMVKLTANGVPVVDKTVVFRVIEGDGLLQPGTTSEANGAVVKTDVKGEANVSFKFGSRAGNGNHRVRARAVGFNGEIIFHASATYGDGNKAGVIAGNNQRGSVRQPLPAPFVLAVTDAGANLIPDADIEFKVTQGTGKFKNGKKTYLTKTDKDGRASAHFILGAEEGLDQQRVTATLVGTNAIAGFTASGFVPGDPGQTSIIGVVLDNQDKPIPAVTIRVDGTSRQAVTDDQGQFIITEVPVGPVHLLVEGSTTTREGEWPTLSYNVVTVPGVKNPLSSPIYLVELDMATATTVGVEDTELVLPEMPGFKLKVKAGSVTFPDGSKTGKLSVTAVNANKIPMPPPNGMQPQFIVTIQPHGAKFDPPAELTLPNVDGHLPGAEVEMYSYDHDLEEFVTIGLGTVSKDGSILTSNVGVGVIKAGWHCGSQAGGSGCCEGGGGGGGPPSCDECSDPKASGSCPVNYSCVPKPNPDQVAISAQIPGNCKTETCGKPQPNPGDKPPEECGVCIGDKPDIDKTKVLNSQKPDDCKELLCEGFNPKDETAAIKAKGGDYECKLCKDGGIENGPDNASCGDGSVAQTCYTCKDGKCGNQCKASSETHTFESTAPDFVLKAVSGIEDIVNKSPIFTSKLATAIDVKLTTGELCCKSCETPGPKGYKEFSGFAGVKGTLQVTVPGLGVAYQMPTKIIAGSYAINASVFATLLGAEVSLNSGATVSYKTTDCPGEDCGSFKLGTSVSGSFGPQIKGNASFDSCTDSSCENTVPIFGAEISGGGVIKVGGNFQSQASSGSQCGSTCFGGNIDPITGNLYFTVGVEILFKKYTYSAEKSIELYSGGPIGNSCG